MSMVDIVIKYWLWDVIRNLNWEGIFFVSYDMNEVKVFCDRVYFFVYGKIVIFGIFVDIVLMVKMFIEVCLIFGREIF